MIVVTRFYPTLYSRVTSLTSTFFQFILSIGHILFRIFFFFGGGLLIEEHMIMWNKDSSPRIRMVTHPGASDAGWFLTSSDIISDCGQPPRHTNITFYMHMTYVQCTLIIYILY